MTNFASIFFISEHNNHQYQKNIVDLFYFLIFILTSLHDSYLTCSTLQSKEGRCFKEKPTKSEPEPRKTLNWLHFDIPNSTWLGLNVFGQSMIQTSSGKLSGLLPSEAWSFYCCQTSWEKFCKNASFHFLMLSKLPKNLHKFLTLSLLEFVCIFFLKKKWNKNVINVKECRNFPSGLYPDWLLAEALFLLYSCENGISSLI